MKKNNKGLKDLEIKVLFYRNGTKCYFIMDDELYECNRTSINKLKEQLILPYKMSFCGMSRAQIGRVVLDFLNDTMDVEFRRMKNKKDNVLRVEATLFEKKRKNEAIKNNQSGRRFSVIDIDNER